MIDAMVNDGDIVIMRPLHGTVKNGEMVAVWLNDKDETTLKYFYRENGHVRLQPANPTMDPIIIEDPSTVEIQGQVPFSQLSLGSFRGGTTIPLPNQKRGSSLVPTGSQ